MNLSRRKLLTGLLSSAAMIAAGPVVKVIPASPLLFGPGPNMPFDVWLSAEGIVLSYVDGISQKIAHTMIYGNPELSPGQFIGLRALV
jgi:hypothetical protein